MAFRNKEEEREYQKKYYQDNIVKKKKQRAEAYQKRKEYICEWSRKNYVENKDKILKRNKAYSLTLKSRYSVLTRKTPARGYAMNISFEDFCAIVSEPCHYCGDNINIMGIDRVDNLVGYEITNSVSCCKLCNMMKHSNDIDTFLNHVSKIHRFNNQIK